MMRMIVVSSDGSVVSNLFKSPIRITYCFKFCVLYGLSKCDQRPELNLRNQHKSLLIFKYQM